MYTRLYYPLKKFRKLFIRRRLKCIENFLYAHVHLLYFSSFKTKLILTGKQKLKGDRAKYLWNLRQMKRCIQFSIKISSTSFITIRHCVIFVILHSLLCFLFNNVHILYNANSNPKEKGSQDDSRNIHPSAHPSVCGFLGDQS